MGLFNKIFTKGNNNQDKKEMHVSNINTKSEELNSTTLLVKHENGEMDDTTFLRLFGDKIVFYSTPFGDHKDGKPRLFALPDTEKTGYLPVFLTQEDAIEFYNAVGRQGFMIMCNTFISFLQTLKSSNNGDLPIKLGAIIDPTKYKKTINFDNLDLVIEIITSN